MVGASKGLGIYLVRAQNSFATDKVFVSIMIISFLSCILFSIIVLISRWAMPWKYTYKKEKEVERYETFLGNGDSSDHFELSWLWNRAGGGG
ncbi:hypothetical protein [Bacillus sp. JCM 19034]|uniref:hypothetical protein n=1 Tax=Bacillus sp. JCM 19034 TaxID=1481928 RepID=UPI0018D0D037|nr:hypothetical protein [Bacillus sp. JCM 19034]